MLPDDPLAAPWLCLAPGCDRLPIVGRLCRLDADRLGQWLAEIGTDFDALDLAPVRGGPSDDVNAGRQSTKVKSRGSAINFDAAVLTDTRIAWLTDDDVDDLVDDAGRDQLRPALEVLAWWAGLIREGRDLGWPSRQLMLVDFGTVCPGRCFHLRCAARREQVAVTVPGMLTVATERALITESRNLRWALNQEWAGSMWQSIRQLWGALKAARGDDVGKPVATCRRPATELAAGPVCGGAVWAERGAGWCGRCGHVWTGRGLLELTRGGVAA